MPNDYDPFRADGVDPVSGAGKRPNPASKLPPELDPRGRRVARAEARREARGGPETQRARQRVAATAGASGRRVRVGGRKDAVRGAALGARIATAVLSLIVLVGSGYVWATYHDFQSNIKRVDAISGGGKDADGKAQNILIVGNDDRSTATAAELAKLGTTKDGGSLNTDTMMLMHVPADGSQATVISFPRDSYVAIPGHGMAKLNSAYVDGVNDANGDKSGGSKLLVQTIENLTGLKVDHFVQVDLLGFYRISNAIGGISVCLTDGARPARYVGEVGDGIDSGWEGNTWTKSYSGIDIPANKWVTIEGTQALAFVRQRHGLPGGDLDRIRRQQYFLSAVFRKLSSGGVLLNPIKLQNLLSAVDKSLTMDNGLDPLKLAEQMQNLQAGNVKFLTIPTDGDNPNSPAGDVIEVNPTEVKDAMQNLINPAAPAFAKAKPAKAGTFTVNVENGTNTNLLATRNADALTKLGFTTAIPDTTPAATTATVIKYAAGMESQAKELYENVPHAKLERTSTVSHVTLVLGSNGVQVKTLMPKATAAPSTSSSAKAAAPATSAPAATPSSSTPAGVTTAAQAGCIN